MRDADLHPKLSISLDNRIQLPYRSSSWFRLVERAYGKLTAKREAHSSAGRGWRS